MFIQTALMQGAWLASLSLREVLAAPTLANDLTCQNPARARRLLVLL
ncbi:MAG: hypothetical protein QNK18_15650 [Gammaproteobacteria bacterium]|nr:hypothetical protein [Gammaproteobacteria bacterium]